jgi:hypothetical protein
MADSSLSIYKVILYDKWPGVADPRRGEPTDGFCGATHHNVTETVGNAAGYHVGDKIEVYHPGATASSVAGLSTFIYLKLEYQDLTNVLAAAQMVALHSDAVPYDVTNDTATLLATTKGPIAIALSAMTTDNVGWFWCGGVAPVDFVPALAVTALLYTVNNVAIGDMCWCNLAPTSGTVSGEIGFCLPAADTTTRVGLALVADT